MKSWMKELAGRIAGAEHESRNGVKYCWILPKAKTGELPEFSQQRTASLVTTYLTRGLDIEYGGLSDEDIQRLYFIAKDGSNQTKKMLYVMAKDLMDHCKSGEPDQEYINELRNLGGDVTKDRTKEFLYDLEIDNVPPGHRLEGDGNKNKTSKNKTNSRVADSQVAVAEQRIPFEFVILALLAVAWVLWDE